MTSKSLAIFIFVFCCEAFSSTTVKVAILDNNFKGYIEAIGRSLPAGTIYHPGSVESPDDSEPHGLLMAQLFTQFVRGQGHRKIPYELHLYQTYGYTNFSEAVADLIQKKIDVVLYAQVWEYGGNNDGRGFINTVVNQAVDAGILWINAAGNFGLGTLSFEVKVDSDNWVTFAGGGIPIRCQQRECNFRSVLSWNDFNDNVENGTNKDLDYFLVSYKGDTVASSELVQRRMLDKGSEKFSKYPREIIETKLSTGDYLLKVKSNSRAWTTSDRLRITLSGSGLVTQTNSEGESLLNPADNPRVVTVGSCDTSDSSISVSQRKPELIAPTIVNLLNTRYMGSSVAAALVAAGAAALRSENEGLDRENFLRLVTLSPGQRRPQWQWNVPNYSQCRPSPLDFVKIFIMPSF